MNYIDEDEKGIDLEVITKYWSKYSNIKFIKPEKAQDEKTKKEMEEFRREGKNAREMFIAYVDAIEKGIQKNFPDYEKGKCSGWIDMGQKPSYFWVEFKNKAGITLPHSISVSMNMHPEHDKNGFNILSFRVEARDDQCKASSENYDYHNKIIDLEIPLDSRIYYQARLTKTGKEYYYGTNRDEVIKALHSREIQKLKVVKNINGPYIKSNTQNIIQESLEAIKDLMPFYEHILQERGINITNKDEKTKEEIKMEDVRIGLNTILYGPPGTGKTYNTVSYAVALCDNEDLSSIKAKDYKQVLQRYNELINEERIAFTTFHQSYSYEEFIEGIRPVIDNDINENNPNIIEYKLESGVFKDFCEKAERATIKSSGFPFPIAKDAKVWKVTVYDTVIDECFKKNQVRIGFDIKDKGAISFVNNINTGDIILTTNGSREYINGIAIATSDEAYEQDDVESNKTTRNVTWLACNIHEDITPLNKGLMMARYTVSKLPNMNVTELIEFAIQKNPELRKKQPESGTKPYVFIIDEINRGNISKIFGELITLIEDTKRKGMPEQISAILPYSGHKFSVPSNVYIIGTMNDIDRSVDSFDFAMRRRFRFIEIKADATSGMLDGLKSNRLDDAANELLPEEAINRMTALNEAILEVEDLNENYQIGASYFLKLKNLTFDELWTDCLRPLLQEYVQGLYDEEGKMKKFATAYGYIEP